ncbi:MAG: TRASH domain-containing protein [Thermoprotei archaeon]|nr:TRASH domain-containing protein [TACK group archaeon]
MDDQKIERLTNDEYRALEALMQDGRMSATELSRRIGVSRATASRLIESLKKKGIAFVPRFYDGSLYAFVVSTRSTPVPEGAEAYDLIDGNRLMVVKGADIHEIEHALSNIPNKSSYLIGTGKVGEKVIKANLVCDFCGGPIQGTPILFKKGRRTYYACCQNCLQGLKKKLGRPESN